MSSGDTSNSNLYLKSALITGVTRRQLKDGRKHIGWALSELLPRAGYKEFVVVGKPGDGAGSFLQAQYSQDGQVDWCYVDMGNTQSVQDKIDRIAKRRYNRIIFNVHYDEKQSVQAQFESIVLHHWFIARAVLTLSNVQTETGTKFIILLPDELGNKYATNPSDFPSTEEGVRKLFLESNGLPIETAVPSIRLALLAMAQHLSRFTHVSALVMYPEDTPPERQTASSVQMENLWAQEVMDCAERYGSNVWLNGTNPPNRVTFTTDQLDALEAYLNMNAALLLLAPYNTDPERRRQI
ncbi:hypothetical protein PFISCL1PPCAC_16187 [Pristionchus fissidentatus]|uniref:Uncharacterized protein n=1 Tax=Pristionchus fissidentatus TaxID=1538716 RepID=A0AAV5VZ98_9BILA|nr:hypothetical protein PFISCL1PPCAC_16187 [Pristionchus fissidentatus]